VPTLVFTTEDGDPTPGALRLTAAFTAFDQYVDAAVGIGAPGYDLSGKTLQAQVRLVSSTLPPGGVQLLARSGSAYLRAAGPAVDAAALAAGTWVPLVLDLAAVSEPDFDPSEIVQIAVRLSSGPAAGGGVFEPTGETVLEIDTVTE